MTGQHLSQQDADDLFALALGDEDAERVLGHIASCEACLRLVDAQWEDGFRGGSVMDTRGQADVQRGLFERIHRSNMTGQIMQLGTRGMLSVFVALLGPILGHA